MNRITFVVSGLVLAVCTLDGLAQAPQITSLSANTLTRSGRLRIAGSNFGGGGTGSLVRIDNLPAIVTRWTGTLITAYVPEQAGPGVVPVQVVTGTGTSNTASLNVQLRAAQGRVRWTFEADVTNLWWRPALAPDGTIYLHGSEGHVYALAPDGGLKWFHQVNWYAYVPPAAGPDGAVYVGSIQRVTALNPNGTQRWQFTDPAAQAVAVGPTMGPAGDIFLAFDLGLGACSFTPGGQLRWNNPGNPQLIWYGGIGAETVTGARQPGGAVDQMYVVMEPLTSSGYLEAFALSDGSLRFSVPVSVQSYAFGQQQTQPAVGPDGTIYITHMKAVGGIGWSLEAYSPQNGQSLWYLPGATSGMTPPEVGPDGIIYYSRDVSRIVAVHPATHGIQWEYYDGTLMYYPTVSPKNDLIVTGGTLTFGDVGFIKGISTSGELLWTVDIPGAPYPEPRPVPTHRPRFTPDGKTAYVSTVMLGGTSADPHTYLYAVRTGPEVVAGDLDGDGDVDESDRGLFVGVLLGTDVNAEHVSRSDMNEDGTADGEDIAMFVALLIE